MIFKLTFRCWYIFHYSVDKAKIMQDEHTNPTAGAGEGGGGFGDKKKGNMKDMQGRLYIVLLVNTLLTQNSLDFVQRATRTNTTNTKELRTNFISQQRICRYVARFLVSRNDGSSGKRRKTILLVALNCSIEQPINMENYRKELLSGVYCY